MKNNYLKFKNLFAFFMAIAMIAFAAGFSSCTNQSVKKEIEKKAFAPSPTYAQSIIANNSNLGFADPEKGRKDSLVMIATALTESNYNQVVEVGNKYIDQFGLDEDVHYMMSSASLNGPNRISWKGGAPGRENSWKEPKNWNTNRIPDEDSHVIIRYLNSGHNAQPIIKDDIQVASIAIYSRAELTVAPGAQLIVDGEHSYSEGISIYGGELKSEGEIIIKNIDMEFIAKSIPIAMAGDNEFFSKRYNYKFKVGR